MCYFGNVCQTNVVDLGEVSWQDDKIQNGLSQLTLDLHEFRPNCVLALGRYALRAFKPSLVRATKSGDFIAIGNYRGSIYWAETEVLPHDNRKLVACYHPTYIQQQYGDLPLFKSDVARAVKQSKFPELRSTERVINIRPARTEVLIYLDNIRARRLKTAFDIEGYADNIGVTMISIAVTPRECLVIPFFIDGQHYWSLEDEIQIWKALAEYLFDPECEKTCQAAMYELFVLAWSHRFRISGVTSDTMFKHAELSPEMEKSLALQTSIYTEEPFYKDERLSDNTDTKLLYNGKDSCVTYESDEVVETYLRKYPRSYEHYQFNMSLLPVINYMGLRGCAFNRERAYAHLVQTQQQIDELNSKMEGMLGRKFNAKSVPDKQWLLYDHLGYEPYKKYGKTTKEEVLLRYYAKHRDPILKTLIELISVRTRKSDIGKFDTDPDGRIRSNYDLVGTSTARISSSASSARFYYFTKSGLVKWDNTGTNMQNVTKELRDCCTADSADHAFFQCDLYGADGWTVAADLAALGNTTMLDDYLAGIKPAKVLLLMLEEHEQGRNPATINNLDRAVLRERTNALKFPEGRDVHGRPGDWKYVCAKRCQHGTNYEMQPDKLSATIFKDSEGLIDLTTHEAAIYQHLYKLRYNPQARIDWVQRELRDKGYIQTACGFRRQFFGLRSRTNPDPNIVREALAVEPQAITTYCCNAAAKKLWYDPDNRTSRNTLFIEPLLQIHDAIAGQFARKHIEFARAKIPTWFDNPITIHGIQIRIPYDGGYGTDWLNCHEGHL
jgi:hypothetical protein